MLAPLLGCEASGSSSDVPPLTGVTIQSQALFGERGCGLGEHQLARYAVTVHAAVDAADEVSEQIIGAAQFDCFADASFLDLPQGSSPSATYTLYLFALSHENAQTHASALTQALSARSAAGEAQLRALSQFEAECKAVQRPELHTTAVCRVLRDDRPAPPAPGNDAESDPATDAAEEP